MIGEAAAILGEGIAAQPEDIDLVTMHGYGFPRGRGGLMYFARDYGFKNVIADMNRFAQDDPTTWHINPKLIELAGS